MKIFFKIVMKYTLFILNTIFSSFLCIFILGYINNPLFNYLKLGYLGILISTFVAFIYSIFPQIILYITLYFIKKNKNIKKYVEIILIIFLGIVMSFLFISLIENFKISFYDSIIKGYSFYISIILSGLIYRIILFKINKKVNNPNFT